MNLDSDSDVRRRAALHAALADPARLAVVDALVLGDATATELQHALGMPSNLLAHHLNVLRGQGLICSTRSEADRRRSYLHLVHDVLDSLTVSGTRRARRVVFVCTAASARSQLAARLWRRASPIPAAAAGTHPAQRIHPGAVEAAHRHGLPLRRVRPQRLDDTRTGADFVVTVCDRAHEELGGAGDLHWSIPDPVPVGTRAAFDTALEQLDLRVATLAQRLVPA